MCKTVLLILSIQVAVNSFAQTHTYKILEDLGSRYEYAHAVAFQEDGKLVVAGEVGGHPCLLRYDTTGMLDPNFGDGGKVLESWSCGQSPAMEDILIQPDGKIVMGTTFRSVDNQDMVVARYHKDGTPDAAFGTGGKVVTPVGDYNDRCMAIALQSDGKIIAAGGTNNSPASNYNYDFVMVRYDTGGNIDSTFGNNGITRTKIGLSDNMAHSIAIQDDDRIILAGEANDSIFSDVAMAGYDADGVLDPSFGEAGIRRIALSETYDYARAVTLQPDGKILVAGTAQIGLSNNYAALLRLHANGEPDISFGTGGVVFTGSGSDYARDVVVLEDNKILVAGITHPSVRISFSISQYNPDGTPDQSFGTGGLITVSFGDGDAEGNAVSVGSDGEIIVVGSFNHGSPEYFDFAVARLFSNISSQMVPLLSNPQNGATEQSTNPTLTWQPSFGATTYNIEISSSSQFDTHLIQATGLPSAMFTVNGLNSETDYYWRVSGTGFEGTSIWSETWKFTTGEQTDIDEPGLETIKLYPNPATDVLMIDGLENETSEVTILSMDGKIAVRLRKHGIKEIELNAMNKGVYVIKISSSEILYTGKIVIQ
jgi:uncharacterized delta-60 repeat protein